MSKDKNKKTNAARFLDGEGIEYEIIEYDMSHGFTNGMDAAEITGRPYEQTYKTLVTVGQSGGHYVCVIPVDKHLSLKRAARHFGEKKIEMLKTADIMKVTGYVHGGCSPLGMRKPLPTVVDARAAAQEKICVSAGRIGMSLEIRTEDLLRAANAELDDVADDEE
ncbi:MAG: Cys-tRNA(Pro) deacylase [Eubacteriaceae bacterium]|jgi:Cys-tRNA(Pro)/Cys-tRNA(Cys) deacylase|nr:Cys-tRNA(Pro) deacylase [Eubacteriaceae bacterium]